MCFKVKRLLRLTLTPVLMVSTLLSQAVWAKGAELNMPVGATTVSHSVYDLHMTILWICCVIGALVFGVMFYSIFAHRKSRGVVPATFHESTKVEVLWTVIPFLILLAIAIPSTKTLLDVYDSEDAELDILITGYQWKWKYEYLTENGDNVTFFSNLLTPKDEINNTVAKGEHYLLDVDEPIVIPVDTKVRFLVTAYDVIHSWWVPQLAVKRDAIPGFINETWTRVSEPGVYRGQCAELCGKDHGFMPIVVHVVSKEDYVQWLAAKQTEAAEIKALMAQTFTLDELVTRGKDVYTRSCLACHGANGEGGLGNAIAGSAIATGSMDGHLNAAVNGVAGTAMQAFGGQLNDVDMAAVVTYQRNTFGNNMGDLLQPVDVYNYKKGQ
jgi:cytochrome c oxidase subunit 2